mgnify:CR=1 FL=1
MSTDATEDAQIFKDEISEFLLDEMDETFNCSLEDGSDQEVSDIDNVTSRLLKSFSISIIRAGVEI